MKLSIVTTLYLKGQYLEEFHQRASQAAQKVAGDDYEIIMVNDGSPDDSLETAIKLCEKDHHLTVIDLSRNFGHHKAMMTGLGRARGEMVFLIDSDLEEEPEWLPLFHEQMARQGCDVVYGQQESRKGGLFERWTGQWFYILFRLLTRLSLPPNVVTARLMTRRYVKALLRHEEREVMIAGLWFITGFDQQPHILNKRDHSSTSYSLHHKLSIILNAVTSFSSAPLRGIFYTGVFISFLAALYTAYLIVNKLFLSNPLSGWTSIMASIWFLGGLIISFLGIIGLYLAKVLSEAKRRPYTIIREIHGHEKE